MEWLLCTASNGRNAAAVKSRNDVIIVKVDILACWRTQCIDMDQEVGLVVMMAESKEKLYCQTHSDVLWAEHT